MKSITIENKKYVLVPREEYDRLVKMSELPPLPEPDRQGRYPALHYARVSLARKFIRRRVAAGLSQRELAKLAQIRYETICRIETGKTSPKVETVDRIHRALLRVEKKIKG
ncbi:MAG: helix-turn-helix transcriptional regulator [Planctomycetaceae bacterium]